MACAYFQMRSFILFFAFSYGFCGVPVLDPFSAPVLTVSETESLQTELLTDITCTDPDGDVIRVYISSVNPSHPCGNCFALWPCASGYCLMLTPSLGSLNYFVASSYVIIVTCTDDIENDVSTGLVEVRLTPNTPPTFTSPNTGLTTTTVTKASNKGAGDLIYDVVANDAEGDAVFYTMTSFPSTDLFVISYGSGEITATRDMREMCEDTVMFTVHASDSHHSPVGPVYIQANLDGRNERPVIANIESVVETLENTVASFQVIANDANGDAVTYTLTASPAGGTDYYQIDSTGTITSIKTLDYEVSEFRSVVLNVDVTDGFCDAETYSVTMKVTDVNEEPVIYPDYVEKTVYEGEIVIDPGWTLTDPDEGDSHVWEIDKVSGAGSTTKFYIDSVSGIVYSIEDFDIDPNKESGKFTLDIKVKDTGSLEDTGVIKLTVMDQNDNEPIFTKQLWTIRASPCTRPGVILDSLTATDQDSEFQGNNQLVFSGTGVNITVLSTGDIVLLNQCTVGQVEAIEGHVTDQGLYPGPLSALPATILFSCNECPVPNVTTTAASPNDTDSNTTTAAATSAATDAATFSTSDINVLDFLTHNLPWLIPAALLALLLAALLAYFAWKYCSRACAKCSGLSCLQKRSPTQVRVRTLTPTPRRESSTEKVTPLPLPPPPPEQDAVLFGFWKETYVDRDQRNQPKRDVKPATVEQDLEVEEIERAEEERERERRQQQYSKHLEDYQQEINGGSSLAKKNKTCIIQ